MVIISNERKVIYEPTKAVYKKTCQMCNNIGKVRLGNSQKPRMLNNQLKKETLEGMDIVL